MYFFKNIDFDIHDGVYFPMLNDFARNLFYEQVLTEVCDQHCVEIGFGTGLLSMLALKKGARSIVAYESDPDRYKLGCEVIKVLKLQDRITLINQRYDYTFQHEQQLVFTETVDDNIWGEGLYNSLPRLPGKRFLPGQYFLEVYAISISADIASNLIQTHKEHHFSPGVDINPQFVSYINLLLSKKYHEPIKPKVALREGVYELKPSTNYLNWITDKTCAGRYVVDANTGFIDDPVRQLQIAINNQPVLIMPRAGMQHNNERLYLDTGHWKPPAHPAVVNVPNSKLLVEHDLRTGKIAYKVEE